MDHIKKLRTEAKNSEALNLALNFNRNNLSEDELIELLDEIIITSWYVDKKNIGVNASLDIMKIYNNSLIELTNNQRSNINFVLPEFYEIDLSKLPRFSWSKNISDGVISICDMSQLYNVTPPFIILTNRSGLVPSQKIKVKYFVDYLDTIDYIVCLTKKWKISPMLLNSDGLYSWDVFDTLIARKCYYPDGIFKQVQNKSGVADFHKIRRMCENATLSSYNDIYKEMEKYYTPDVIKILKELEYQTEIENLYPIRENFDRVKECDILISDIYYSTDQLRGILDAIGLKVKYELYTSYGGKNSGKTWETLISKHRIYMHTGDSQHSDVNMPRKFGINSRLFNPWYTQIENLIKDNRMENISLASRYLRLSNPYKSGDVKNYLWDLESNFNIPLLLLYAEYLNIYCKKFNCKRLLMCTRDCSKFYIIFKQLYPEYEVIYFHSSRDAYNKMSPDYIKYIKSLVNDETLIIDLVGTGKSGDRIFEIIGYPKRFYFWGYSDINNSHNNTEFLDTGSGEFLTMEILNQDIIGCLVDVELKNNQFFDIRREVTHNIKLLDFVDGMINMCLENKYIFDLGRSDLSDDDKMKSIKNIVSIMRKELNSHTVKLNGIFGHNEENVKNLSTIKQLANKYGSDKGDLNFHKHQYSRVYDIIFSPLKYKAIKILEIGLSISSTVGKSTSINIWYDYFDNAKIYGYDIKNFSSHDNDRITIFQGDQSNEDDLNKFISLYGNDFDVIIDDGYHSSIYQQQSLKILFTKCLKSNGIYILEDLHYIPIPEINGVMRTKDYLRKIKLGDKFQYGYLGFYHDQIVDSIKKIDFYDTLCPERFFTAEDKKDAMCVIYKA